MEARKLISGVILPLAVLLLIASCAKKPYAAKEDEEIYGTWVNTSYGTTKDLFSQKRIYKSDGTLEEYGGMADIAHLTYKYTIIDKWTDSEGNIWYKLITEYGDKTYGSRPAYELRKISNSGLT
ncbi:hypothetical protein KA005_80255, partial [bacterium]|nr:hypothetical protein [bacterium]